MFIPINIYRTIIYTNCKTPNVKQILLAHYLYPSQKKGKDAISEKSARKVKKNYCYLHNIQNLFVPLYRNKREEVLNNYKKQKLKNYGNN